MRAASAWLCRAAAIAAAGVGLAALTGQALAADDTAAAAKPEDDVVPYCIEPMDSMLPAVRGKIPPQVLCKEGTHLQRQSRPAQVLPTGEESSERPFVLRFGSTKMANAWFVRGYRVGDP